MFSSAFSTLLACTPERPNLGDLVTTVKEVSWDDLKPILLKLDVPLNKIDDVERRHPTSESERKTRALDIWLKMDVGATWEKFISSALDVDPFCGNHIASRRPYRPMQPAQQLRPIPYAGASGYFPGSGASGSAVDPFSGGMPEGMPDFAEDAHRPATKPKLRDKPTLAQLRKLTVHGAQLYIIREVAGKWDEIAISMDFDPNGHTQTAINKDFSTVQEKCTETFKKWLQGMGSRQPATWKKLVEILRDCEFAPLASRIKAALR